MKSKYQSAVAIGVSSRCNSVGPLRKMRPHVASLAIGEYAPRGDFIERPQAADAQAGHRVDPAYVDARRWHPSVGPLRAHRAPTLAAGVANEAAALPPDGEYFAP